MSDHDPSTPMQRTQTQQSLTSEPAGRSVSSPRFRVAIVAIALTAASLSGATIASGQDSAADARAERQEIREQRAAAAGELDAARAEDADVQAALDAINESVLAQENALVDAQRQLDTARAVAIQANEDVEVAQWQIAEIRAELSTLAVTGFVADETHDSGSFDYLAAEDPTAAMRRSVMLQLADTDAGDLLEQMRIVQEDSDIAQAIADNAVEQAAVLEAEMAAILVDLEAQQVVQASLKAELAARVADWEATVTEYEAEEAALSEFIRQEEAKVVLPPPAPAGQAPSAASGTSATGFQWPIAARVTSEFGWRIHPIYGTKRLHAGIDLGAGSGTPIGAAAGGTVIFAGVQGGYGNTVVISHGNGISTLYAHQSKIGVSNGAQVSAGDVIGYVGSTGASTGPHLHLEVRVNGSAVNPRGYLP